MGERKGAEALRAAGVLSSSRCHTVSDTNDPPDRLTPPPHLFLCFPYLAFSPIFGFFTPSPLSDTGFDVDNASLFLRFFFF